MSYGEFDPTKYPEEARSASCSRVFSLSAANAKKCAVSMDGMSVSPERSESKAPDPGAEMVSALRFVGRLRKAVGAFFDNLPES